MKNPQNENVGNTKEQGQDLDRQNLLDYAKKSFHVYEFGIICNLKRKNYKNFKFFAKNGKKQTRVKQKWFFSGWNTHF